MQDQEKQDGQPEIQSTAQNEQNDTVQQEAEPVMVAVDSDFEENIIHLNLLE